MAAGTRTHSKWVQTLCIPGILAILILLAARGSETIRVSFSTDDFVAIAFPAGSPSSEVENALVRRGIDTIISEDNVLVPMTDFVRLEYLTLSEVARRVKADDPRHTPLTAILASSFAMTEADEPWRIWFVPVDSSAVYEAIQSVFTEIGGDWAWDAQPPSPVLRFLWIIWLAWILWLLAGRPVKSRLYHGVLIAAWIPLAFIQTLPAAALMVVGQGISTILGMHIMAGGRKQRMGNRGIRKLLVNLAPFLLSMLFLLSIDPELLIPVSASGVMLILLKVYREQISKFLEKRRLHCNPPFRLILDETLREKAIKIGIFTIIPLVIMITLNLIAPFRPGDHSAYQLVFIKDPLQKMNVPDYIGMIRSHTVYQEAITWGRLGEASWMTDTYTRPYRFEMLGDRIVRGVADNGSSTDSFQNSYGLDKELKRILEHTKGGTPLVIQGDDIPRNNTIQLDSLGVVFYIMSMAPFCVLGLRGVGQSRRRIITSYLNRQVA